MPVGLQEALSDEAQRLELSHLYVPSCYVTASASARWPTGSNTKRGTGVSRLSQALVFVPRIGLLAELSLSLSLSLSREMMSFDSSLDISLVLDLRDTVLCVTVNSDTDDSRF